MVVPEVDVESIGVDRDDIRAEVIIEVTEADSIVEVLPTSIREDADVVVVFGRPVEVEQLALEAFKLVGAVAVTTNRD